MQIDTLRTSIYDTLPTTNVDANSLDIANLQGADATLQTNIDNAVPKNLMNFNDMIAYTGSSILALSGDVDIIGVLSTGNLDVSGNILQYGVLLH
ncbi:MAG TPA: hypothetical protein EYN28_05385 [Flavobacteriales bacterium]|nr:hypothetical protein [Flavobacteriales bacterium]HIO59592.1 hypothetical protein [Flavobacteriales bacterium]